MNLSPGLPIFRTRAKCGHEIVDTCRLTIHREITRKKYKLMKEMLNQGLMIIVIARIWLIHLGDLEIDRLRNTAIWHLCNTM